MSKPQHDVALDYAGFNYKYERFTCYSKSCKEATILRQPHMTDGKWGAMVAAFKQRHPHEKPRILDY